MHGVRTGAFFGWVGLITTQEHLRNLTTYDNNDDDNYDNNDHDNYDNNDDDNYDNNDDDNYDNNDDDNYDYNDDDAEISFIYSKLSVITV